MATYIQSYFSPPQPFVTEDIHLIIEATSPLVLLALIFDSITTLNLKLNIKSLS